MIYLASTASLIVSLSRSREIKFIVFWIITVIFILVLGLRSRDVGIDTPAYYSIFNIINSSDLSMSFLRWEPGFVLVNKIFSSDVKILILVLSLLSIYHLFKFIYEQSPNITLSLILFIGLGFYFFLFNGVRQAIATSILTYSFKYLYNKKYIIWIIYFIFAISFHYTALIFLFYFLFNYVSSKKILLLAWLSSLALTILPQLIIPLIQALEAIAPQKYLYYLISLEIDSSMRIKFFVSQLFFLMFYYCYIKISPSIEKQVLLISIYSVILSNILTHLGDLSRLSLYFEIFQIIAIPITINHYLKGNSRYLFNISTFVLVSLFYYRSIFINSNGQYPYTSWLQIF